MLLVIVLAAISGVVGGVVGASADSGNADGSSAFIDRVAEILGIAPEDVSSAISQARDETRTAHFASKLDEAVEAGVITQEEADAITEWFAGKPDALKAIGRHGLRTAVKADEVDAFLAGLVEQGLITQDEAGEISAWLVDRPSALESLREWRMEQFKSGDFKFRHGWGRHGGFGGHGGHGGGCGSYGGGDSTTSDTVSF